MGKKPKEVKDESLDDVEDDLEDDDLSGEEDDIEEEIFEERSEVAKQFIAGQLKYSNEIVGILAPTVNSYKRLVPGYEAPVYISWAQLNHSALIRTQEFPKKEVHL